MDTNTTMTSMRLFKAGVWIMVFGLVTSYSTHFLYHWGYVFPAVLYGALSIATLAFGFFCAMLNGVEVLEKMK